MTQYHIAASGGTYYAYPLGKADFTDWVAARKQLVEVASTGKYKSDVLTRSFGDQWAVFSGSGTPSAWTDSVGIIDLGKFDGILDIARDTPYGVQVPYGQSGPTDISRAINWALKYMGAEDPDARSPAGGPRGSFLPWLRPAPNNTAWYATNPIFVPNKQSVTLMGGGYASGSGAGGVNTQAASHILFNISDKTRACIVNQASGSTFTNLGFYCITKHAVGMLIHRITQYRSATLTTRTSDTAGVATLASDTSYFTTGDVIKLYWSGGARQEVTIDSKSGTAITFSGGTGDNLPSQGTAVTVADRYHQSDNADGFGTGTNSTQITTECNLEHVDFYNFTAGVKNGGYKTTTNCDHHTIDKVSFDSCTTGWLNFNDQGVNIKARDISNRNCDKVFDFQAGGYFMLDHALSAYSDSVLVNIGKDVGVNNGYFRLRDIKTDTRATNGAHIIFMEDSAEYNRRVFIHLDGGSNARRVSGTTDDQRYKFVELVGRAYFKLSNYQFPGHIVCHGGNPGGAYDGSEFKPMIDMDAIQFASEAEGADPTSIIEGDYNEMRCDLPSVSIGWDPMGGTIDKVMPVGANAVPDKPLRTEMNTAIADADYTTPEEAQALIEQYATYAAPETGASGSITWS